MAKKRNNVVKFPNSPITGLPNDKAEADAIISDFRKEYMAEAIEIIMENMSLDMSKFVNLSDELSHQKDWFFLCETLEATMYRYARLPHHLHDAIDDAIRFPEEEQKDEEPVKKVRKPRKKKEEGSKPKK